MNQRTVYPCERAGQMRRNSFAGVKIKDERDNLSGEAFRFQ